MNVGELADHLERLAPLRYAAEWDHVGLLVGGRNWPAQRVLLTIDLTEKVLDEAIEADAEMIVAYHPPIFHPLPRLTDETPNERIILRAASARIAIYSPHTALDAAPDGVNDWLGAGLGPGDVRALEPWGDLPAGEENKIVTFCPADAVEKLRNALAAVGAGTIGDYEQCSFEISGTGTFLGGESTQPVEGTRGRLERIEEVRLEMVCPSRSLALAVASIRNLHPYEEPPIEIHPLRARPQRGIGQGRRVVLDQPASLEELAARIKRTIGSDRIVAAVPDAEREAYQTIGLCAGAGGSLVERAIAEGCELFLTGEMRHHDVLEARARGCAIILAGHTNTERGYLPILARRLCEVQEKIDVIISEVDVDPLMRV